MKNLNLMLLASLALLPSMASAADRATKLVAACKPTTEGSNCQGALIKCKDGAILQAYPAHNVSPCTSNCQPNDTINALSADYCAKKGGFSSYIPI